MDKEELKFVIQLIIKEVILPVIALATIVVLCFMYFKN
jgi:hypothetical protein